MDEKELLGGTPEEEITAEETVETEETAEIEEIEEIEEIKEIEENVDDILAEQDALDADAETVEQEFEEMEEEEILPDPLEEVIRAAEENEAATSEQVDLARIFKEQLSYDLNKAKAQAKKLGIATIALSAALVLSLSAVAGLWIKSMPKKEFAGLELGKSYKANIKLPDYTNLTYNDTYQSPTEQEIQDEIESAISAAEKSIDNDVTDKLKEGDVVTIDFDGYIDGEKYENACGTNQELELGSGRFIDGFESGLIGKEVGDKVTLNLTFPEDYSEVSLQGQDIKFEVKITAGVRTTYPELTDALAKELSKDECKTVDEYKAYIFKTLDEEKKENAEKSISSEIWTKLLEESTLKKYPQNMYDSIVEDTDELYSGYYSSYASYGVTDLESFVEIAMGTDLKSYIENQIRYHFITYAIAAEQDITLTDADYESLLEEAGVTTREELEAKLGDNFWRVESDALYKKVTTFLVENAKPAK